MSNLHCAVIEFRQQEQAEAQCEEYPRQGQASTTILRSRLRSPTFEAMASTFSFDIVSEIDLQEADNAVNQATKEIAQRYDFKGSDSTIKLDIKEKIIQVESDTEYRLKQVVDVLESKLIKRGIGLKALTYATIEQGSKGSARQKITLQSGIDKEHAKQVTKLIKDLGLKVQAMIQDDQVRVTGKDKDSLQEVIAAVKGADLPFDTQFTNYR